MTSKTDLANKALAYIGVQRITDIADPDDPSAVVCNEFVDQTIAEVLREHRWNCSVKRTALSELSPVPDFGFSHRFQLPGDCARILEVNGEEFEYNVQYMEVENNRVLFTDSETANIRYVSIIPVAEMDPLLARTVALKLAMDISVPLSANLNLQGQLSALYQGAIAKARQANAFETGNKRNPGLLGMMQRSPMLQAKYTWGHDIYSHGRYFVPFT